MLDNATLAQLLTETQGRQIAALVAVLLKAITDHCEKEGVPPSYILDAVRPYYAKKPRRVIRKRLGRPPGAHNKPGRPVSGKKRRQRRSITDSERARIVARIEAGAGLMVIAREFKRSASVIQRVKRDYLNGAEGHKGA